MKIMILIFKNYFRQITIKEYIILVFIHVPLNIIILIMMFSENKNNFIDVFLHKYSYIFASQAFVSGLLSWEVEVYAGIYPYMSTKVYKLVLSRTLFFITRLLPITLISILLLIFINASLYSIIHIILLMITMGVLGTGFALSYGFNSEKSLNNINHLSIWIFSMMPGMAIPLESSLSPYLSFIFPQSVYSIDELFIELLKLTLYFIIALYLICKNYYPAKKMYFRK
ncbi:hypothetical protein [Xenorhabdus miraniensis]|uniref:Uncharacterized protein n=1 Tax=Xenorhabdus miraniensis TaxID=351674 RepID=A0A2D0JWL8_9GAMM|nr:hypothetical protein [Xenorhabdus miraniensis]PHM50726.1 hypothetical protein Xmir_00128 [Xenorhabdus miraniensis]